MVRIVRIVRVLRVLRVVTGGVAGPGLVVSEYRGVPSVSPGVSSGVSGALSTHGPQSLQ